MAIFSTSFVERALLKYNYFPRQKKDRSELPPCFSSKKFTPQIAKKVQATSTRKAGVGWDAITYNATRFNGVSRPLSIPHPFPQARLGLFIAANWEKFEYAVINKRSLIRPRKHSDGRMIIMDYEASSTKLKRQHHLSFSKRFRVHTDIANCFPSVYSHAIPWSVVGFAEAKDKKDKKNVWFNKLDEYVRLCKRNETNGIAIGPATSNIIVEAILAKVDLCLAEEHGFSFVRYIDDYTAYCSEESDAQRFVRVLADELAKYKFLLNIKKTKIEQLPEPVVAGWVTQLNVMAPRQPKGKPLLNVYEVAHYLSAAQKLASQEPDGSVVKYALATILRAKLRPNAADFLIGEMLVLAFHYPIIIPQLKKLLRRAKTGFGGDIVNAYEERLNVLLEEHAKHHRSDSMCWLLHFIRKMEYKVSDSAANAVVCSKDCLALLCLYFAGDDSIKQKVIDFTEALDTKDLYLIDSYWLLLYELFYLKKITNPYEHENAFELMRKAKVTFWNGGDPWNSDEAVGDVEDMIMETSIP